MKELPDPSELLERLRRQLPRLGFGRWRLRDDLLEAAYDAVVDRALRDDEPLEFIRWHAFSLVILQNLIRSGPERVGLDRRRFSPLDDTLLVHAVPAQILPCSLAVSTAVKSRVIPAFRPAFWFLPVQRSSWLWFSATEVLGPSQVTLRLAHENGVSAGFERPAR